MADSAAVTFAAIATRHCPACRKPQPVDTFAVKADGTLATKCLPCHENSRERGRAYREANRERENERRRRNRVYEALSPEARKKRNVRRRLRSAIKYGRIVRPNVCQECGAGGTIHAHHEDYSKPFDVDWLCTPCHGKRHRAPSLLAGAREEQG